MADSSSSFFVNEESAKRYGWKVSDFSESRDLRRRMTLKSNIDVEDAVDGVRYIAEKMKSEDDDEGVGIWKHYPHLNAHTYRFSHLSSGFQPSFCPYCYSSTFKILEYLNESLVDCFSNT